MDNDLTSFVLRPGVPSLLHVLHQTSGLPLVSKEYKVVDEANVLKGVNLTAAYKVTLPHMVENNIKNLTKNNAGSKAMKLWSVKADELAVEIRLQYISHTKEVLVLCCQHNRKK